MRSSKAQIISGTNWKLVGCVRWRKEVMKSEGSFTFTYIVLDIIMWCFYIKKYSRTLSVPKMLLLWKGCKNTWELAAVKGSCAALEGINGGGAQLVSFMGLWSEHFRFCRRVVDTFVPVLPFGIMVPPVEQCPLAACHSPPASGACGASATCWVMSSLYVNYICYIDVCICVYTHIYYVCLYLHMGVWLFHRRVLRCTWKTLLRPRVSHLLRTYHGLCFVEFYVARIWERF